MARIDLGEVLQNIAGSVGDHTYGCWKGVSYLRQKAVTISNPCSSAQASVRAALTAVSKIWYAVLTAAQRALWEEYAKSLKSASEQVGPNGNGGAGIHQVIPDGGDVLSGFNAFVKLNVTAAIAELPGALPIVPDAPLGIPPPNAPTGIYLFDYCHVGEAPCWVLVRWVDPLDAPVGSVLRMWALSLDAGVHKQIVKLVALAEEHDGFSTVKTALGAVNNVQDLPGHYLIQMDCVSPTGQKSPPSNVITVQVTPTCEACEP